MGCRHVHQEHEKDNPSHELESRVFDMERDDKGALDAEVRG